jgi:hypothetical protein
MDFFLIKKMGKKLYQSMFFTFLMMFVLCNSCVTRTSTQKLLYSQKKLGKEELVKEYVRLFGNGISACMPILVVLDSSTGYAVLNGDQLWGYYKRVILDSAQLETYPMEDYYIFAANLLLKKDTIKINPKRLCDYKWWSFTANIGINYHDIYIFPIIDSIINYTKEKKQKLINLAFDDNACLRKKVDSEFCIYQPGSIIIKLFEWDIFMVYYSDGRTYDYALFDDRIFKMSNANNAVKKN